jgi:hypothetical protein
LLGVEAGKNARGTFDLSFGSSDIAERVTGLFDAPFCELPMPLPADPLCE